MLTIGKNAGILTLPRTYFSDDISDLFVVDCMPIVQVSVWEGMTPENKKKTVELH